MQALDRLFILDMLSDEIWRMMLELPAGVKTQYRRLNIDYTQQTVLKCVPSKVVVANF